MFGEFTQYTVEVPGEPPAIGYSDDWIMAIYKALPADQQKAVRVDVRDRAERRNTRDSEAGGER